MVDFLNSQAPRQRFAYVDKGSMATIGYRSAVADAFGVKVGDLLVVPATGAYCFTMRNNYNGARRPPVVFVRDGELTRLMHKLYPSDEDEELLAYLQRAACVVVDDLGRTAGTPSEIEPFLRYRFDEGKPTIVTVNDTVVLPATLHSFLHEFIFITFAGEDRRIHPLVPDARW
jgi:hypothetical protein